MSKSEVLICNKIKPLDEITQIRKNFNSELISSIVIKMYQKLIYHILHISKCDTLHLKIIFSKTLFITTDIKTLSTDLC
jgi:hypothetical protein